MSNEDIKLKPFKVWFGNQYYLVQAGDLEEAAELGAMVHKDKNGGEMEVAELKRYAEVRLGDNNG